MLQRLQQLMGAPRCLAVSQGGFFLVLELGAFFRFVLPKAVTYPLEEGLFMSALLGCWEKPSVPLSHCISGNPTTPGLPLTVLPALHPRGDTSPRSAYRQGSRNCWSLMQDPSPSPHLQETARGKKASEVSWEEWTTSAQNTVIPAACRASSGRRFTERFGGSCKTVLFPKFPVSQAESIPQIYLNNIG